MLLTIIRRKDFYQIKTNKVNIFNSY